LLVQFDEAMAQAGVAPSECLYIDDAAEYCEAGRALGLRTVVYTPDVELRALLAVASLV